MILRKYLKEQILDDFPCGVKIRILVLLLKNGDMNVSALVKKMGKKDTCSWFSLLIKQLEAADLVFIECFGRMKMVSLNRENKFNMLLAEYEKLP